MNPSADAQLDFLTKLQRLLAEGDFTATYKFALLIAISDLALEKVDDLNGELFLTADELGRQFISLYWNHVQPYLKPQQSELGGVLSQNNGSQAAVLTAIRRYRSEARTGSLAEAMRRPDFASLSSTVARIVMTMPVPKLQNFGGTTNRFLYVVERTGIRLRPGVASCCRRFHGFIQQLARSGWIRHVRNNRLNQQLLGEHSDLEQFLFSTSRQSLQKLAQGLVLLEGKNCFYCSAGFSVPDVDHFIPVAQYHRDLGHNFVLACPACNRSKSDSLAGLRHIERWRERLDYREDDIRQISVDAGIPADFAVTLQVARWGYQAGAETGAMAWLGKASYESITGNFVTAIQAP